MINGMNSMSNNRDSNSHEWLSELNTQQRRAVTHGDGPLLVIAGAGSGKTRTLAYRVAYLIASGVKPHRILLLTFTRRAAKEMLSKAASAVQGESKAVNQVWGGTFHAIANRLLRIYARAIGLSQDFTIIDQSDAEELINVIRHKKGYAKNQARFPRKGTCYAIYSRRMNSNLDLETILKDHYPWCVQWKDSLHELFKEYVVYKQDQHILDYDDLLLYWYYLLEDAEIAQTIEKRFDYILVDEYQDTNQLQAAILLRMRRSNKNVMAVGDDAQSIYSFRYATVRNILDFPKQFPDTAVVTLEQNYRSVEPILRTTNAIIAQAKERYSKDLFSVRKGGGQAPQLITCSDEMHEDEVVTTKIMHHYEQGMPLHRQAVLFRSSSHSMSLELALMRMNIPFQKYGGLRFLEAAHVKDLICFLRIVENPQDEMAWFRILQLFEGVGPVTASRIFEYMKKFHFESIKLEEMSLGKDATPYIKKFSHLLQDLETVKQESPSVQIDRISAFYMPLMKKKYDNEQTRGNDIQHLGQLAGRYRSRTQFLTDLVLDPPVSTSDFARGSKKEEDWLTLSTIHSAKGCEWDVVYLIHTADGCLPSDMAVDNEDSVEEELRLVYVAMTRARDHLYVLWPLRLNGRARSFSDTHTYAQCSRFFTSDVCSTMDLVTPEDSGDIFDEPEKQDTAGDIQKKIQGFWE